MIDDVVLVKLIVHLLKMNYCSNTDSLEFHCLYYFGGCGDIILLPFFSENLPCRCKPPIGLYQAQTHHLCINSTSFLSPLSWDN